MKVLNNSLVIYKGKPAIVRECGEKFLIALPAGGEVRVREKDIEFLHPGPVKDFASLERSLPAGAAGEAVLREIWELVAEENRVFTLDELAELADGGLTPGNALLVCNALLSGLYFSGTKEEIRVKSRVEIEDEEKKRRQKEAEEQERQAFLIRLKERKVVLPDDARYLQDVEALALGKSEKSRTMHSIGLKEEPAAAHRLLLELKLWDEFVNPYPARLGVPVSSPGTVVDAPPEDEERADLTHLDAYAIDDEDSTDPDDAVSFETADGGEGAGGILYIHVADPAASVFPGSPSDIEARVRGATLYSPECTARMLPEKALDFYALGLTERSKALTFKLRLAENGDIEDVEIFRSLVRVRRLSYREADSAEELRPLEKLAERNLLRRLKYGATVIDLPQVYIKVRDREITITPSREYKSNRTVRECMLLAGEGAAKWALERHIPFPFISQETQNPPADLETGYAGAFQLRKTMRSRVLSTKPGLHQGLGLDIYTQVTSPLRRYIDLLAHQQIRAFLRGEKLISADEMIARLACADRATVTVTKAERASRLHWTAAYLSGKEGMETEGIILEKRGIHITVLIPSLGMETQTVLSGQNSDLKPNDAIRLTLSKVRLAGCEINWLPAA